MGEEIRKLIANRVSYLITQEKQTPQFAVFCSIHDILLEMWSICHNDQYPSDISSDLYDRLHDEACSWADQCLKEVK
jgi:hypothetical protein